MPKLKDGKIRKTCDGLYQVRYRRGGYNVQFTSKDKKTALAKFREWVESVNEEQPRPLPQHSVTFAQFAERYFDEVKRLKVDEETCRMDKRSCELHILPEIGNMKLKQITPLRCQKILAQCIDLGHGRTAETLKGIMNEVFRAAVGERLIRENPMAYVEIPRHIRKQGVALGREEIKRFIERCAGSVYGPAFMVFLYTGIRRGEFKTAIFNEDFITVTNGKCRKGQRKTTRKIPTAPGLKKYLPLSDAVRKIKEDALTNNFSKLMPEHTLKDLRHTFSTVCQECGISKELVDVWTAHVDKKDMTSAVYTHFSAEFQLREIRKLEY